MNFVDLQENYLINIGEYWQWKDLLVLHRVDKALNQLIKNDHSCWNSTGLRIYTHSTGYIEFDDDDAKYCSSFKQVPTRQILIKCPLLKMVRNLQFMIDEKFNNKIVGEVRDVLQLFKHLSTLEFYYGGLPTRFKQFPHLQMMDDITCGLINNSAHSLTNLHISFPLEVTEWLRNLMQVPSLQSVPHLPNQFQHLQNQFPLLQSLSLVIPRKIMVSATRIISDLTNLTTLTLNCPSFDVSTSHTLQEIFQPILLHAEASLLTKLETNLTGWTPELIFRFLQFRTFYLQIAENYFESPVSAALELPLEFVRVRQNSFTSTISSNSDNQVENLLNTMLDTDEANESKSIETGLVDENFKENETDFNENEVGFNEKQIQVLSACQEFDASRNHSLILFVQLDNLSRKQIETFLFYTKSFRRTFFIEPSYCNFFMGSTVWNSLAQCCVLETISITFKKDEKDQISASQIQYLRPIYRQLQSFQLNNTNLRFTQYELIVKELMKMTNLTNRDVFNNCKIRMD